MKSSESGGDKVFGRFAEPAQRVLDLAGRRPSASVTATSALSTSCSACSTRATAGPPGCCEWLGWS